MAATYLKTQAEKNMSKIAEQDSIRDLEAKHHRKQTEVFEKNIKKYEENLSNKLKM